MTRRQLRNLKALAERDARHPSPRFLTIGAVAPGAHDRDQCRSRAVRASRRKNAQTFTLENLDGSGPPILPAAWAFHGCQWAEGRSAPLAEVEINANSEAGRDSPLRSSLCG